jgi:hypothetical protein
MPTSVRLWASEDLSELGRADALLELAHDQAVREEVRLRAIEILGRLKLAASEIVAGLQALARIRSVPYAKKLRLAAQEALARLKRQLTDSGMD